MRRLTDYWPIILGVLAFTVQWGMMSQKIYAYDNDRASVTEVKDRLARIEGILASNASNSIRIEAELTQIRQILMKNYGAK